MSYPYPQGGGQYHQPQPPQQAGGQYHQSQPYQQSGELFYIGLLKHTGALILWFQQTVRFTGTLEQCERAYRDAQNHCLIAGWWSIASLLLNPIALFHNRSAIRKLRNLAQQPQQPQQFQQFQQAPQLQQPQAVGARPPAATPAGWYPDPSGHPGQRYWDGATWTGFTHPPAHR
ncbi:DUF2510 domain-containing protein [Mycobacterium asiaticum]|uniref:DUF2510 domain-containing protein n=1 Tax=Mycobacterium asiaticum TaxID=1790 RepID=A0A1A3KC94_MYCAS|nr:DUF2510 domain-containing protein [Mycobacterium asiaticum]OBJ82747.1 hypothetical protein A5640_20550 [Mycobacterium asiaticum]